jgi:phage protein D
MPTLQETQNNTVRYEVKVSGKTCTQQESLGLESLWIEDHMEKIGMCVLTFSGGEIPWKTFKEGDDVEVLIGGNAKKLFVGTISGMRHSWKGSQEVLVIEAMDPLIKLAASTVTKSYNVPDATQSDDQIAKAVMSAAKVDAGKIDSSSLKKYTLQLNESNLTFLKKLAGRNGFMLVANEGKVDFIKPQSSDPAVEIPSDQLMNINMMNDQSMIPKKVVVIGFDYFNKKVVKGECSSSGVEGVGGGSKPNSTTYSGTRYVTGVRVDSDAGAKSAAEGIMEGMASGRIKGRATIQGNGSIFAGSKVKFVGFEESQNATVMVISARHTMAPGVGFRTQLEFRGDGAPE